MNQEDVDKTMTEALFSVRIALYEFRETCKDTPEGRRLLRILDWLSHHPRVLAAANWIGSKLP